MKVIVNADDFGESASVNRAIIAGFEWGVLSSTSIMANRPGFFEACELARNHDLPKHVGLHINLTSGRPLTEAIQRMPIFCDAGGAFAFRRKGLVYFTSRERAALAAEVAAQIAQCRAHGLPLTHADSHHHVHTVPAVFAVLAPVLKAHDLHHTRLSRNTRRVRFPKNVYKAFFNRWVGWKGLKSTTFFGGVDDFRRMRQAGVLKGKAFEIMVHPVWDASGEIVDAVEGFKLVPVLREALAGISIAPYGGG